MTFNYQQIDEYQIEVTTYCNAACPQCPRNINGHGVNERMPLTHLPRDVIDQAFGSDLCSRLRQVFFCGSYGDPIMHPDFLDILQDFRRKNPTLWLYIHTNGGTHTPDYWRNIANIMGGYGQIDFGIDGLEDTLHLYRRNVRYDRVINNAQAFIKAGGRAQWNFIVFRHNEHQIDRIKELGRELGFFNVLIRKTGRFFDHSKVEELSQWPVEGARGIEYYLEPPTLEIYRNQSMLFLPDLKKQYSDLREYFDSTVIRCDALLGKKVAVNAEGLVLPCNFFNHNLYDRRFYELNVLPGNHELSQQHGQNQVRTWLARFGFDALNIKHKTLEEIFGNSMWQELVNSWTKPLSGGRIFECAMTCGSKLTKVWDQGGSKR